MDYVTPPGKVDGSPYTNPDPTTNTAGDIVSAEAIEHPMREVVRVITDAGLVPDSGDLTQLSQGISAMIAAAIAEIDTDVPSATESVAGIVRLSTVAEAIAGLVTDAAVTPEGLAEAIADISDLINTFAGRTMQDVIGSRATGVTYTNTSSVPINAIVTYKSSTSTSQALGLSGYVNGALVGEVAGFSSSTSYRYSLAITIPPGGTYKFDPIGTGTVTYWYELKP